MNHHKLILLTKVNNLTLIFTLLLIFIGGVVRSLGAGMGCPDWPKCFGKYIPPVSTAMLPNHHEEIFKEQRLKKNKRLANVLIATGFKNLAKKIMNDPNVTLKHTFDAKKAWIEYVNRLVGVFIGFLVTLNMIFSLRIYRKNKKIAVVGVIIFILTVFQGWIGSLVVSTNLLKGFITLHLVLALLMLALLVWTNVQIKNKKVVSNKYIYLICLSLFIFFVPQLLLGTEIRGAVDELIIHQPNRGVWSNFLPKSFYVHRSFSWLFLIGSVLILVYVNKRKLFEIRKSAITLLIFTLFTMLSGISMAYFSFPFWIQPIHLLTNTLIFTLLSYIFFQLKFA